MQRQDTSSAFVAVTREYDNLSVPFATAGTVLPVGDYSWTYASMVYSSDRTRHVFGTVAADLGGYYNGDRRSLRANININIGKTLLLEPNYTRNHVQLPGRPLYTSNVMNFRVSHSFSPDFYLKGFVSTTTIARPRASIFCGGTTTSRGANLTVVYNQGWTSIYADPRARPLEQSSRVRSRSLAVMKLTYWSGS
jgi:hypothetical protein